MNHIEESKLALAASNDLNFYSAFQVRRHTAQCDHCRLLLEDYRTARMELSALGNEMPAGVKWDRLAADMKANIHLGLAAGEIVAMPVMRPARLQWQMAVVMASLTTVILTGWYFSSARIRPFDDTPVALLEANGMAAEATDFGVELKEKNGAITLLHRGARNVNYTMAVGGGVRASYVDASTGQVTVTNVSID